MYRLTFRGWGFLRSREPAANGGVCATCGGVFHPPVERPPHLLDENVFSFEAPLTALSHISFALCLELG